MTSGLSVILGALSLTTSYSSEYWVPLTDFEYAPLTLPTIHSLDLIKYVNCLAAVNHSSYNYGSSYWSNMACILEFLDMVSLIQTSESEAVILTTVEKMS